MRLFCAESINSVSSHTSQAQLAGTLRIPQHTLSFYECAAVGFFTTRVAEKLREHCLLAGELTMFVHTDRFADVPQYANSACLSIAPMSDSPLVLLPQALRGLERIYRSGCQMRKAGVLLNDLELSEQVNNKGTIVMNERLRSLNSPAGDYQSSIHSDVETEYRGLKINAASNLHTACFSLIQTLDLLTGARALDLGAGEGAFSQRLIDNGYAVTAVERQAEQFRADVTCLHFDLNDDFDNKLTGKFDLIAAIEIIEHLYNPRHFIRNCLNLLNHQGYLLITSPNVESWVSRIRFLRQGRLLWFDETDYDSVGHVTPIFSWQIAQICRELQASLRQIGNTQSKLLWKRLGDGPFDILRGRTWLMGFLYPLMKGRKGGEINIYLISHN